MLLQKRWAPVSDAGAKAERAEPITHAAASSGEQDVKERKKKRKAESATAAADVDVGAPEDALPDPSASKVTSATKARARQKRQKNRKLARENFGSKDVEAAHEYLRLWSVQQQGSAEKGAWRFNKATQAWLIRHVYESDKVPKDVFPVLLRYLDGLQGIARDRMSTDADTIVTLRGAPLVEKEPELPPTKTKREKKKEEAAERARDAKKKEKGAEGDAPAEEEPAAKVDDQVDATEAAEATDDAGDAKQRKMRLLRAKKILAALAPKDA